MPLRPSIQDEYEALLGRSSRPSYGRRPRSKIDLSEFLEDSPRGPSFSDVQSGSSTADMTREAADEYLTRTAAQNRPSGWQDILKAGATAPYSGLDMGSESTEATADVLSTAAMGGFNAAAGAGLSTIRDAVASDPASLTNPYRFAGALAGAVGNATPGTPRLTPEAARADPVEFGALALRGRAYQAPSVPEIALEGLKGIAQPAAQAGIETGRRMVTGQEINPQEILTRAAEDTYDVTQPSGLADDTALLKAAELGYRGGNAVAKGLATTGLGLVTDPSTLLGVGAAQRLAQARRLGQGVEAAEQLARGAQQADAVLDVASLPSLGTSTYQDALTAYEAAREKGWTSPEALEAGTRALTSATMGAAMARGIPGELSAPARPAVAPDVAAQPAAPKSAETPSEAAQQYVDRQAQVKAEQEAAALAEQQAIGQQVIDAGEAFDPLEAQRLETERGQAGEAQAELDEMAARGLPSQRMEADRAAQEEAAATAQAESEAVERAQFDAEQAQGNARQERLNALLAPAINRAVRPAAGLVGPDGRPLDASQDSQAPESAPLAREGGERVAEVESGALAGNLRQEADVREGVQRYIEDNPTASREDIAQEARNLRKELGTDVITGLRNKRGWDEALKTVDPDRDHVAIIDLKGFKPINDRISHAAGNVVLKGIGGLLRKHFGDDSARQGGDEFGAILRGLTPDEANARVEAFREELRNNTMTVINPKTGESLDIPGIEAHIGVARNEESADLLQNLSRERTGSGRDAAEATGAGRPGTSPGYPGPEGLRPAEGSGAAVPEPVEAAPRPPESGLGDRSPELAPGEAAAPKYATRPNYSHANPFAEKATRARAEAERLNQPTARERGMADAFPLGAGFGRGSMRSRERGIDASVNRASRAVQAVRDAEYLEAQANAYEAGEINAQGRSINRGTAERREKAAVSRESREERIQAAREARGGKAPWEVARQVYADASGQIAGSGRKLVEYEHGEAVARAVEDGKAVPAEVLADYPDLGTQKFAAGDKTWGDLDGWKQTQRDLGFSPEEIDSAVRESFRRGIDPTMSDTLHSLDDHMTALDEMNDEGEGGKFAAGEEQTSPSITRDSVARAFPSGKVSDVDEGRWMVDLPGGRQIRVDVRGEIAYRVESLQKGHPDAVGPDGKILGNKRVVGAWNRLDRGGIIQLAKVGGDEGVLGHEVFHSAMDLALSPKEQAAILKQYGNEEAAADAYGKWTPRTMRSTVFQKIRDFFRDLYRSLFPDAESVFRRVRSGEAFGKAEGREGGETRYAAAAKAVGDRVENFRRWFGESKVVDESGAPLVVYKGLYPFDWTQERGTVGFQPRDPNDVGPPLTVIDRPTEFPAFNRGEAGVKVAGFFGDKATANHFAKGTEGAVMPVYLSLQKPYVVDAAGRKAGDIQFGPNGAPFREAIRSGKYDGVIIRNTEDEGTIYVALKPGQIKSAIGNSGTFDPDNPDIRYATAPKQPPPPPGTILDAQGNPVPKQGPVPVDKARMRGPIRPIPNPIKTEVSGRPVQPGEAPRVEARVENLRKAEKAADQVPAELDRETKRTWKSLEPEVQQILREWDDQKFYNAMKRRTLTDSEVQAWDAVVRGKEERLAELKEKLAEGDPKGETGRELAAATLDYVAAQRATVNDGTGAGRALAARARVMDASRTPDDRFLRQIFREIPKVSDEQAAAMVKAYREDPDALLPLLQSAIGHSKIRKGLELFKANLLSAFSTDVANLSGNLAEHHIELAETGLSSGLDWALQKVYGGDRARFRGEMGAEWAGSNKALGPALKKLGQDFVKVVVKGQRKPIDIGRRLEYQTSALSPKGLGQYTSRVFGKLEVADDFFKAWGAGGELAKQAYRKASAELPGKSPKEIGKRADQIIREVGDPENAEHAEIIREVDRSQRRRTFQEVRENTATELIGNVVRRIPMLGFAFPFVRTPGNIAARILERSPIGLVKAGRVFGEFKEMQAKQARGEATTAEVSEARGKLADALTPPLLGTALLAAFTAAARAGLLTGSGPTEEKDRNTLRETGWSPYSLVLPDGQGGKLYLPFNRFEPISSLLGFAADMSEAKDAKSADDLLSKAIGSLVQNLSSKSYLQSLSTVGELVGKKPQQAAAEFVKDMAGAVVPNIVARGTQAIDPKLRDTKPERSGLAGVAETVGKTIASRLPGLSALVPEKRSGTGETIEREGNAVTRFASPVQPSRTKKGRELEALLVEIDAVNTPPSRELKIPKTNAKVRLTDQEYALLQEADKQATEFLRKATASAAFRRANPDEQQAYIKRAYSRAGSIARNQLLASPALRKRAAEAARAPQ